MNRRKLIGTFLGGLVITQASNGMLEASLSKRDQDNTTTENPFHTCPNCEKDVAEQSARMAQMAPTNKKLNREEDDLMSSYYKQWEPIGLTYLHTDGTFCDISFVDMFESHTIL